MRNVVFNPAMIFSLSVCCFSTVQGQINLSKFEAGITAGSFIYQGDLTPSEGGSYKTMMPQFGVFGSRLLSRSFALRLHINAGMLRGDDSRFSSPGWRQDRNFKFNSALYELAGEIVWDIFGRNYNRPVRSISPYLFAGVGYGYFHPRRDYSHLNTAAFNIETGVPAGLVADEAAARPHGALVLPAGIGVRYRLTQKISIIGESAYRFMHTDYLDGFSYAANPSKKDHYYSHSLGIIYAFGKKNSWDCPVKIN